jgi:hypothetical protein
MFGPWISLIPTPERLIKVEEHHCRDKIDVSAGRTVYLRKIDFMVIEKQTLKNYTRSMGGSEFFFW